MIKIPGAGKKETKGTEGEAGKGEMGKKRGTTTAADFSPPRSPHQKKQQQGKPRTKNALNSLSEFSAG